jgi:hypothetical protein
MPDITTQMGWFPEGGNCQAKWYGTSGPICSLQHMKRDAVSVKGSDLCPDAWRKLFVPSVTLLQDTVIRWYVRCILYIPWGMLQRTILQRTVFINKIKMLQRTRRNTIGRRSTRVRMTCRAFPFWLKRQSSSLLSFVSFSCQFSSVICLFVVYKS